MIAPWEDASQSGHTGKIAKFYQEQFGIGLVGEEASLTELSAFLPEDEIGRLISYKNTATQIINEQSRELSTLHGKKLIDNFRQMELAKLLKSFYTLQSKNERIKKFSIPRQYANMSRYFVGIFILLLPFRMIPELSQTGDLGFWLSIPITILIGWVYVMMEVIGDSSENPFQGMVNDISMLTLCRVIEIDWKEMSGETDLSPAIESKKGVLI